MEKAQYLPSGYKTWNPCDAMLVGAFLFKSHFIRKESLWSCVVDLSGYTRGQMVLDHMQEVQKNPKNVRIIELVDSQFFQQIVEWGSGLREFKLSVFTDEPQKECVVKLENGC